MRLRGIGLAISFAFFFLTLIGSTLQSASSIGIKSALSQSFNVPQSGTPTPFVISVTLHPDMPANLIYTNTDNTVATFEFLAHTTDITRTIYLVTETHAYAAGMSPTGYVFGLIPFQGDMIDTRYYQFSQPVSLTIKYPETIIPPNLPETQLDFYHSSANGWILAGNTCNPATPFHHDIKQNLFYGSICNTAYYGIFGTYYTYLPTIIIQH